MVEPIVTVWLTIIVLSALLAGFCAGRLFEAGRRARDAEG